VIASLKQRHPLPLNQAVRIEIPAGVQDSLTYACGMDMFGGTILAK